MSATEWGTFEPIGTTGAATAGEERKGTDRYAILSVAPRDLLAALRAVEPSRSKNDARPILTFVHFMPAAGQDGWVVEAADNYRVVRTLLRVDAQQSSGTAAFLLPPEALRFITTALKALSPLAKKATLVRLVVQITDRHGEGTWSFEVGALRMTFGGYLGSGTYPDIGAVMGHHEDERTVAVNPRYLADAARTVVDAGDGVVLLTVGTHLQPIRVKSERVESIVMALRTPETEPRA